MANLGSPLAFARQALAFGNLPFRWLLADTNKYYLVMDKFAIFFSGDATGGYWNRSRHLGFALLGLGARHDGHSLGMTAEKNVSEGEGMRANLGMLNQTVRVIPKPAEFGPAYRGVGQLPIWLLVYWHGQII
jgi:hypothetical protein